VQYDIDLLCLPENRREACRALSNIGYVPQPGPALSDEHERPLVRPYEWKWRGDYYDPDMPIPLEIHSSLWDPSRDRIRVDAAEFWNRRTVLDANGLAIPALHEVDRAGFAALHVLRHVLRNDAKPAAVFELARFLRLRAGEDTFWRQWLRWHDPRLRELESAGFRFAAAWFDGAGIRLRPAVEAWFRMFAWSPIANLTGRNKDAVWLHLALLRKRRDRGQLLLRRLVPFRPPRGNEDLAQRIRYHAGALAPTLWSGFRFWWRSTFR
jgi:Uncharacterised nucleotidyltransferase